MYCSNPRCRNQSASLFDIAVLYRQPCQASLPLLGRTAANVLAMSAARGAMGRRVESMDRTVHSISGPIEHLLYTRVAYVRLRTTPTFD